MERTKQKRNPQKMNSKTRWGVDQCIFEALLNVVPGVVVDGVDEAGKHVIYVVTMPSLARTGPNNVP